MNSETDYLKFLVHQFWDYAESELALDGTLLDSERRDVLRPPVFRKDKETHNLLIPSDADDEFRAAVKAILPLKERHRWFRSMKSSQAVAQSVFGSLIVSGNFGLLEGLESDEGLPAFCEDLARAHYL